MSRVGQVPVSVPDGVDVTINGSIVSAKGKLGELSVTLTDNISSAQADKQVSVKPTNLVIGVSEGFSKKLEVNGTGYRAQVQGNTLVLQLGFSHDVNFPIPEGIKINCPDQTHIEVSGANKQRVGQVAAEIRSYRPPEPYKGKGVKYEGEYILRKEGKKK